MRSLGREVLLTPETSLFNDLPRVTESGFKYPKDLAIPGYLHPMEARLAQGSTDQRGGTARLSCASMPHQESCQHAMNCWTLTGTVLLPVLRGGFD